MNLARIATGSILALLAMTACSSSSAAPAAVAGGSVVARLTGDWSSLDPQNPRMNNGNQGLAILHSLYDTLAAVGPDSKSVVPYLAKSWKATPSSITFTLRSDASCADGTKITPSVVKNSYERGVKTNGSGALLGPGPYSMAADEAAGTFTWSTQKPDSEAIYWFATNGFFVCPAGVTSPTALETSPQGSGPYTLDQAVHGDHFSVKLRPDWKWGPLGLTAASAGLPQQIVFKVVTNETTAANLLVTGGLDVGQVTGADVDRLLADKDLTHKTLVGPLTLPLLFNQSPGRPTADPAVRQALMSAVDRNQWNRIVYQGRGFASPSFLGPGGDCYDASVAKYLPANPGPERAKQILTAAGWTLINGKFQKDGRPLVIDFPATTVGVGSGPDYVDSVWDSAGITVKYASLDFNTWLQRVLSSNFDTLVIQNSSVTPSPSAGASQYLGPLPPTGFNWGHVVNPEADSEWQLANASVGAQRCQHWSNVQRLLLQHLDILPLAAPATQWFSRGLDFAPGVASLNVIYVKRVK